MRKGSTCRRRPVRLAGVIRSLLFLLSLAILAPLSGCLPASPPATSGAEPASGIVHGARRMVSVANPLAAGAAMQVLKAGGSAVDAAIAAQMVLTLVEPQSSGIGGGAFMLHYDSAAGALASYDGRETAPRGARPGMFLEAGKPMKFMAAAAGGTAVGVPGVVRMLELAHAKHGRLPWKRLFEPAIELAEAGFAMSPRLARLLARETILRGSMGAKDVYYTKEGELKPAGTPVRNSALAMTLRAIADGGADAFYRGAIARGIVDAVQRAAIHPGSMSYADLAAYRAIERQPICQPYRHWKVCGMGPPSSGGIAVAQTLAMLERFDLGALTPGSIEALHLMVEAEALAFADRNSFVADADFVPVPIDGMLAPDYLSARARLIDPKRAGPKRDPGQPVGSQAALAPEPGGDKGLSTTHFVIVDATGNAVSMTSSIETVFGSRLMTGGFILNNQLTDFSFEPFVDGRQVANSIAPAKRPRSSMSPTMVFDGNGKLVMALGSPGGSRIIGFVLKTLVATLDWRLPVQQAIDLPNALSRNGGAELENGAFAPAIKPALEAFGHKVKTFSLESGLHAIRVHPGGLEGGADKRREGVVLAE
jgi:gamma-glutamyltranspeptidase/glutathione hydrolase